MIAALAVLAFAGVDLLGWGVHRRFAPRLRFGASIWAAVAWSVAVGALAAWLGGSVFWLPVIAVLGVCWAPLTSRWPVLTVVFLAIVAALAAFVRTGSETVADAVVTGGTKPGMIVGFTQPPSSTTLLAAIAVALFLGLSANLICRAALDDARRRDAVGTAERDHRLRAVLEHRWSTPPRRTNEMRGGRLIGPLERWLIAALALVGAQGIVAALMAAKGIVRFPEISKDSAAGSKAEEFLIGSLVSWALAGAGAALVWSTL